MIRAAPERCAPAAQPPLILLVAPGDEWQPEARDLAAALGAGLETVGDVTAALAWTSDPRRRCSHVLLAAPASAAEIDALAGLLNEGAAPGRLVLLGPGASRALLSVAITTPAPPRPRLSPTRLREALYGGMLRARFQPILDAGTRRIVGLEALARLHHPTLGVLRPETFLPQIEAWGFDRVLLVFMAQLAVRELQAVGPLPPAPVGLNVPLSLFRLPSTLRRARAMFGGYGVDPGLLTAEVLESELVPDPPGLARQVARWREAGFRVAIDDAGPRQPEWRRLLDMPFSTIKLDGVMVDQPDEAARMIDLAHRRGIYVVAEGVRDEAAAARMTELGADALQGFHFARPLPALALTCWLARAPGQRRGTAAQAGI